MSSSTQILSNNQVEKIVKRLAFEVYERNFNCKSIIIAAINGRGEAVAKMIEAELAIISTIKTNYLVVNIDKDEPLNNLSLSNEDLKLENQVVILVDDVLNSGRTLIYAMLPFLKNGVKSLQTLILVDRNHSRFPVKADFIGTSLSTTLQEHVAVLVERKKINVYLK